MVHQKANRDANGISFLTDDSSDLAKNWSKKTLIIWPAINYLQNQKQLKRQKSALDIFNWHFEFYEQVKQTNWKINDAYFSTNVEIQRIPTTLNKYKLLGNQENFVKLVTWQMSFKAGSRDYFFVLADRNSLSKKLAK